MITPQQYLNYLMGRVSVGYPRGTFGSPWFGAGHSTIPQPGPPAPPAKGRSGYNSSNPNPNNYSNPGYGTNAGFGNDPMAGQAFGSGQRTASPNRDAGDRRLEGSSVNYGNVAGIQNYLENQMRLGPQAYQAAVQSLLQQGIMPSVNGEPMDQIVQRQAAGQSFEGNPGSAGAPAAGGQQYQPFGAPAGASASASNPAFSNAFRQSSGGPFAGLSSGFGVNGPSGGSLFGGKPMSAGTSGPNDRRQEGGPLGLPLEGRAQGAILNMFDNPTGLSPEQTQLARNRSSSQIDAEGAQQRQNIQADAIRRGVNPSETAGSMAASGAQQSAGRISAQNNFDFQNAQAGNQGRLAAAGAAGGIMNAQIGNEDSIRRYLAMLGANASGNRPAYLVS